MSKIILGTAQFGKGYGISCDTEKSAFSKFNKIKKICSDEKIDTADISDKYYNLFVYNKLKKTFKKKIYKISDITNKNFKKKIDKIIYSENDAYCIMIHNPSILKKKFFLNVVDYLIKRKNERRFRKIGISIYNIEEFWHSIKVFGKNLDIIQLPINIIDRRFLQKKIVNKIKKEGIEIHARSVFLQGMLIMKIRPAYFDKWKFFFRNWDKEKKLDKINICLNFIKKIKFIDKVIVGSEDEKQLKYTVNFLKKKIKNTKIYNYKNFYSKELNLINPTKWII